jgi:aspartyl-tRNA(Asn)/glutamyl-tRNA(Gln) amidotransferase subunit C
MISKDDVRKLANLARIKLSPEEEEKFAKDMEDILGYVNQIQSVSTTLPDPRNATVKEPVRNVLRDDTHVHESGIHTDVILNEAPAREGNYLKVKKILG